MAKIKSLIEILTTSTKLGLTSFGGPIAHLGYFHSEYVSKRKWIDEKSYADLVALCQFLPGPASSQVGIGIGIARAGLLGGIISFIGFTLPSVIVLMIFALLLQNGNWAEAGWLYGLKIVAVAIVAHAITGMAKGLTPDTSRKAIALLAISAALLWQTAYIQIIIILLAGLIGYFLFKQIPDEKTDRILFPISKRLGTICLSLFFILLIALPILSDIFTSPWLGMFDSFYRSGSLVFGGGHVVLPLLENEFVSSGTISEEIFLAGYGATQAVPGPLFTFAAYLGTAMFGWQGGLLATLAIFLPAFLLIVGVLPFWNALRRSQKASGMLMGINAAVVGLLIAAFFTPIWTSTIVEPIDFVFAAVLYFMLAYWKLAPWIVVLTGAAGGFFIPIFLQL